MKFTVLDGAGGEGGWYLPIFATTSRTYRFILQLRKYPCRWLSRAFLRAAFLAGVGSAVFFSTQVEPRTNCSSAVIDEANSIKCNVSTRPQCIIQALVKFDWIVFLFYLFNLIFFPLKHQFNSIFHYFYSPLILFFIQWSIGTYTILFPSLEGKGGKVNFSSPVFFFFSALLETSSLIFCQNFNGIPFEGPTLTSSPRARKIRPSFRKLLPRYVHSSFITSRIPDVVTKRKRKLKKFELAGTKVTFSITAQVHGTKFEIN